MDKRVFSIGLMLFFFLIQLPFSQGVVEDLGGGIGENLEDIKDRIVDDEARSEYLKEEWGELLEGSFLGKVFKKTDEFLTLLDPFFRIALGVGFSFSALFFLILLLWIFLLNLVYNLLTILEVYIDQKYSTYAKLGSFAVAFVVVSTIRISKFISEKIVELISNIGIWMMEVVLVIFVIAIIIFSFQFSRRLKETLKAKAKHERISENREDLSKQTERIKKIEKKTKDSEKYLRGKEMEKEMEKMAREDIEGASNL